MKDFTVGLAGFGKGAEIYHAPFITSTGGLKLELVNERNRERSKELYPDVTVVKEYKRLLDSAVDIIIITTPNDLHYEMAREALLAGKHVVVDKPFTITVNEADELIELAAKSNKLLTVYHNRRLDGPFQMLQKVVRERLAGFPEEVEIRFDRYRPNVNREQWKESSRRGSGLLYDLGPHLVDQALALFGMPEKVQGELQSQREGSQVDDYFSIDLLYENYKVKLGAGMLVEQQTAHISIRGSEGKFVINDLDTQEAALKAGIIPGTTEWKNSVQPMTGLLLTDEEGLKDITVPPGDYGLFYRNLVSVLRGNEKLLIKPSEARDVISVLEQLKQQV